MTNREIVKVIGPQFVHLLISVLLASNLELNILEFLGLYLSLGLSSWFIYVTLRTIYNTWVGVWLRHNTDLKQMGSWAVVTGASDGIGLAYCKELAKLGINVVLMSRTMEKLQKSAKLLEAEYGIDTMTIEVDFSQGIEAYEKVEVLLSGLDIGVLINNVGMTYPTPSYFHDVATPKFINDIINLNALAVTMMTRIVLPGMLDREKGVIVNIGSVVSCTDSPWFTLYGASKAYMEKLTDDLALEYKDRGIIFQYQIPGYVSTKLSRFKSSITVPSPEDYAKCGIRSIGLQKKTAVCFIHRMFLSGALLSKALYPAGFAEFSKFGYRTFWLFARKREMEKLHGIKCHRLV